MQIKTTKYHFTPVGLTHILSPKQTSVSMDVEQKGHTFTADTNVNWSSHFKKQSEYASEIWKLSFHII